VLEFTALLLGHYFSDLSTFYSVGLLRVTVSEKKLRKVTFSVVLLNSVTHIIYDLFLKQTGPIFNRVSAGMKHMNIARKNFPVATCEWVG